MKPLTLGRHSLLGTKQVRVAKVEGGRTAHATHVFNGGTPQRPRKKQGGLMPNPTTAAEWSCFKRSVGDIPADTICNDCADAHAHQEVAERDLEWNRGLAHIRQELGDFPDAVVPGTVKGVLSVWGYRQTRQQVEPLEAEIRRLREEKQVAVSQWRLLCAAHLRHDVGLETPPGDEAVDVASHEIQRLRTILAHSLVVAERLARFLIHRASCPLVGRNYLPDAYFLAESDKCTCGLAALVAEAHQLTVGAYDDLEANARLIAKAPEMLSLLRRLIGNPHEGMSVSRVVKDARALLREIEGDKL